MVEASRMKAVIDRLMRAGSATEFLEQSDWLNGCSPEVLEEHYARFSEKFARLLQPVTNELGDPNFSTPRDQEWFKNWYPEAYVAAAWELDSGWLCLAAEHQDDELPIGLVLRSLTVQEREELAE